MEYVAIAFRGKDFLKSILLLNQTASQFGFQLIEDSFYDIDSETEDGVKSFMKTKELSSLLYVNQPTTKKTKYSSEGVSNDLSKLYLNETSSNFLDFLKNNTSMFPQNYFLLFAYEWHENDLVRFFKTNLSGVEDYFKKNNSWYLWLYDYKKNFEQPDLDTSLVIEVDNTSPQ